MPAVRAPGPAPGCRRCRLSSTLAASRSPDASPATIPMRCSADDATGDRAEKREQRPEVARRRRVRLRFGGERLAGLVEAEAGTVQGAVGAPDHRDVVGAEAAATQPLAVDAVRR